MKMLLHKIKINVYGSDLGQIRICTEILFCALLILLGVIEYLNSKQIHISPRSDMGPYRA